MALNNIFDLSQADKDTIKDLIARGAAISRRFNTSSTALDTANNLFSTGKSEFETFQSAGSDWRTWASSCMNTYIKAGSDAGVEEVSFNNIKADIDTLISDVECAVADILSRY
jgi:hypothetical protein